MMQRWLEDWKRKYKTFLRISQWDEDKVFPRSTPVANGALMTSQMNRQHAKEWQEASSNVAGQSDSLSLCKSLVSLSCSFLSFCALFESICMPWLIFRFLLHHVACSASLPLSLFLLSLCFLCFSPCLPHLHDELQQNIATAYL